MNPFKQTLARYAKSLGFERFGVTSAFPAEQPSTYLKSWLDRGCAGEMDYLRRDPNKRSAPVAHLPGAQSVIALAASYWTGESSRPDWEGKVASYARGKDYHSVLRKRLDSFVRYAESLAPDAEFRTFLDTGPLLEKHFAQQAGLGFMGKNTMLITKGLGSWVFLAHVVTTIVLPSDAPDLRSCGDCRLCIDACPTQAITAPYSLDPRRCISYLTIELKSAVPIDLRDKVAGWLFGCDICQDVCPHNTRVPKSPIEAFRPRESGLVSLRELLNISDPQTFERLFEGSPLKRPGLEGLQRNACLAAVSLGRQDLIEPITRLASRSISPALRETASWAVHRLASDPASDAKRPSFQ